jgi:thioredoxin
MPIEITEENFHSVVEKEGIVLVDWWAEWCGPCRAFAPVFDAAASKHADVVFGKVNTDEQQELSQGFGISSIPTLMVFRDGILLYAEPGAIPASGLETLIQKVREVDMADVRKKLAEHEAAEAAKAGSALSAVTDEMTKGGTKPE